MNYQELSYIIKEMNKLPYPEVKNIGQDYKFGRMLYDAYAGNKSELTTILTYVFQDLNNSDKEDLAMLLGAISKQEMKHLELLGQILVCLGLEPYYMSTYGNKWCSDNVKSNFNCLEDMLNFNIESEKEAIEGYKKLIDITDCDSIKTVLARIIIDEENHVKIFEMLKKKYCGFEDNWAST